MLAKVKSARQKDLSRNQTILVVLEESATNFLSIVTLNMHTVSPVPFAVPKQKKNSMQTMEISQTFSLKKREHGKHN